MSNDDSAPAGKALSPAALRALAEAAARREEEEALRASAPPPPREINGRAGPDPARFGDWESKGIASDF